MLFLNNLSYCRRAAQQQSPGRMRPAGPILPITALCRSKYQQKPCRISFNCNVREKTRQQKIGRQKIFSRRPFPKGPVEFNSCVITIPNLGEVRSKLCTEIWGDWCPCLHHWNSERLSVKKCQKFEEARSLVCLGVLKPGEASESVPQVERHLWSAICGY